MWVGLCVATCEEIFLLLSTTCTSRPVRMTAWSQCRGELSRGVFSPSCHCKKGVTLATSYQCVFMEQLSIITWVCSSCVV